MRYLGAMVFTCAFGLNATLGVPQVSAQSVSPGDAPPLTGSIVFLYYQDIDRAARFYGETLGLKQTYYRPQVRVFAVTPSAAVGIIDVLGGGNRSLSSKTAGVSLIVENLDDVDRWFALLESRGVNVTEPPSDGTDTPVRSVQFTDPEGYEMEVFAWLPEQ